MLCRERTELRITYGRNDSDENVQLYHVPLRTFKGAHPYSTLVVSW